MAKTSEIFRSRVIVNDKSTNTGEIKVTFGINFSQACLPVIQKLQRDNGEGVFVFKDVIIVKN